MIRILVFGDSIAYGAWDSEGGWVDRLKREYHREYMASDGHTQVQVLNLGVGGHTSSHVRDRLRAEIEFRNQHDCELALVFCFGTNDAASQDGVVRTSAQRFRENVQDILVTAQAYADKILFVGPPPLSQPEVSSKDRLYADVLVDRYEQELITLVEKTGLPFVSTRPAFVEQGLEGLFAADGLHPKDEGHELIYQTVYPEIIKLLQ